MSLSTNTQYREYLRVCPNCLQTARDTKYQKQNDGCILDEEIFLKCDACGLEWKCYIKETILVPGKEKL